jgi:molybdopterin-guanine dinucleotide biosynthesis protein A
VSGQADKSENILGVIIAGGKSVRMQGYNKLLLPFGRTTILEHVIDRLSPQVHELYLNCNDAVFKDNVSIKVVPDAKEHREIGPIGGLITALTLAKSLGYQKLVTVAGDTPFLPDDFVSKLCKNEGDVVVACSRGRLHPVCALWDIGILNTLEEHVRDGKRKLMPLLDELGAIEVSWATDPDPFFNINTPADHERAKGMVQ